MYICCSIGSIYLKPNLQSWNIYFLLFFVISRHWYFRYSYIGVFEIDIVPRKIRETEEQINSEFWTSNQGMENESENQIHGTRKVLE